MPGSVAIITRAHEKPAQDYTLPVRKKQDVLVKCLKYTRTLQVISGLGTRWDFTIHEKEIGSVAGIRIVMQDLVQAVHTGIMALQIVRSGVNVLEKYFRFMLMAKALVPSYRMGTP